MTSPLGTPPHIAEAVAEVLALTCLWPPGEVTHWLGRDLRCRDIVTRRAADPDAHRLQPHRLCTFSYSLNPAFASNVEDVLGLYMDSPAHAVVPSLDEKSKIQALERTRFDRPLAPGHPVAETHNYNRLGTTTLFAALDVRARTRAQPLHAVAPK